MKKLILPFLSIVTNAISLYLMSVAWAFASMPLASDVMSYIKRTSVSTIDIFGLLWGHIFLLAIAILVLERLFFRLNYAIFR